MAGQTGVAPFPTPGICVGKEIKPDKLGGTEVPGLPLVCKYGSDYRPKSCLVLTLLAECTTSLFSLNVDRIQDPRSRWDFFRTLHGRGIHATQYWIPGRHAALAVCLMVYRRFLSCEAVKHTKQ